jgi:meso-butanediol dehydrogenase/(S,S)-butanediol dehydrogenase/diacetyl reductase
MAEPWRPLEGRVALVTGAGRGLGYGVARALGRAGARVCLTDVDEAELARAAALCAEDGTETLALPLDVSDAAAFRRTVVAVVERWERLDALVHAAILMPLTRFADTPDELWWRQLQVSLGGLFNATRAAWPVLAGQGGGHIIGVASGSSVRGYRDEVAYCTAKHAQEGFFKALALESAPLGIAVNSIGPGAAIKPTGISWAELERLSAEQRSAWADPADLGRAFAWLAAQPPRRFSGLRFDAGPIVRTLDAEGPAFSFAPEKVTLYVDDFVARQRWMAEYPEG